MFKSQPPKPYAQIGTTSPIYIPKGASPRKILPDSGYFLLQIKGAQAAFSGPIWEQARQLVVTSQVNLNHAALRNEPVYAIQRALEVKKGSAEQLGLSQNLIDLIPAVMPKVSISLDFLLDKKNVLAVLSSLINDNAFIATLSLSPGAAMATRVLGSVSQKLIQTFLEPEERMPILSFQGDFNLAEGWKEGQYVIMGTRDERYPLPGAADKLDVQNGKLLINGEHSTHYSYVIIEARLVLARTRALNDGAAWDTKIRQAEGKAASVASDPFLSTKDKQKKLQECKEVLQEARPLLMSDPNYLPREAIDILKSAYAYCYDQIFSTETKRSGATTASAVEWPDLQTDLASMGLPADEPLAVSLNRYADQVAETRRILKEAGLR
jgi:hypothetical protein